MNSAVSRAKTFTIVGAGLAGSLMAIMLARQGWQVRLIERRADLRLHTATAGRSINLALAERGIHALRTAGVFAAVSPLLLRMTARCLHDRHGQQTLVPYGQRPHEVIYSVSRRDLNRVLLDAAQAYDAVHMTFDTECLAVDWQRRQLQLRHDATTISNLAFTRLLAADGVGSAIRPALQQHRNGRASNEMLAHGYKELTLPADAQGHHQLNAQALHIWPRGSFMLIALPNVDGSFTLTLFLPLTGSAECADSFAQLHDALSIERFFAQNFPDALALMPNLADEFMAHPIGTMSTLRCSPWTDQHSALLIGDAAHAMVPFHGQGMNCAFEDCVELLALLQQQPFGRACQDFEQQRKPNTDAIADMALENYLEMRDVVRQPSFLLQKELAFELERRCPERFIPRYSMVMFHHEISYATAYERGAIQARLLTELTRNASTLADIDMNHAVAQVQAQLREL